ncbi:CAMK family protein kinase [Trichomonas vaginalis G3]|uniref:CAMK family protein kinase n=1 Tax=Trichomonas vaginalis (strain ATCC PRA-98 / G3) TaxID=412133 RepID=A2GCH6_TRIV3|nr:protein serine/threonine kinase protein [Trichomonas vaginalis G3]EAX85140.1 CAMK family protein kinase [Trichomonas vaginalis G3]KAI5508238.1 protein serine/threonine kinase protein [Trichomonas vaginalis G3]|eukprot:XP_001298070.1 CAMK family protein kinase [Trichomonas vaginalis G3]
MVMGQPYKIKSYSILETIGKGTYAKVVRAFNEKTSSYVAIKIINRQEVQKMNMMRYLESEIRLLQILSHSSLPKIHEIIYTEKEIFIVMEYFPNGNMAEIPDSRIYFTYKERFEIVLKIAECLNYLHERSISHRDIKPENIVFDVANNPILIDFGLSIENHESETSTFCGSPTYMAPEIITNKHYDSKKADIWAFAVTVHFFMSNELPFDYSSEAKFLNDIRKGKLVINNKCSGDLKNLLDRCFNLNPEQRPTIKQIVESLESMRVDRINSHLPQLNEITSRKLNRSKIDKNAMFFVNNHNRYRLRKIQSM